MKDRSHLSPTATTDKNGRRTTVYRRPDQSPSPASGARALPRPVVAPETASGGSARAAAYAERLAAIAETNRQWEHREHPAFDAMRGAATERIGFFVQEAAQLRDARSPGEYAGLVGDLYNAGRYLPLLAAEEFAGVYSGFGIKQEVSAEDIDMIARLKEKLRGDVRELASVMIVADKLIGLGLLAQDETPEIGHDPRFFAHLRASAIGLLNYNAEGILDARARRVPDHTDWIRLLDEHPAQFDAIAEAIRRKVPCETIRAALDDGHAALLDGVL